MRTKLSAPEVLRDFWEHRPVRPVRGAKVAGVSAALGVRYGIDPIIIRITFVLATLYSGCGVLLYLLGWVVFPKESDRAPSRITPLLAATVLFGFLFPALVTLTEFAAVVGTAVCLGGLYLLHRNYSDQRVELPREPTTASADPDMSLNSPDMPLNHPSALNHPSPAAEPVRPPQPPSWDPLGAAPFAWDLPSPSEPEPAPPKLPKRRSITLGTLGAAMVITSFAFIAGLALPVVLALLLAVLGVGMVVGAFVRGGRGLIGFAIPVAAAAIVASVLPVNAPWRGVGAILERPVTVESVRSSYLLSLGDITLDLTSLPLRDQPTITTADVDIGFVTVHVPQNADVTTRCSAAYGSVACLAGEHNGQQAVQRIHDVGPDGPGGGQITLDLSVGLGSVEVIRG